MVGRILVLSLIAGLAGGGAWYLDFQKKQRELEEKREAHSSAKSNLNATTAKLSEAQAQLKLMQEKSTGLNALAESKQTLTEEISVLQSSRQNVMMEFSNDVQVMRLKYTSIALPEVRLENGTVYRNVRFQTITDTDVSLAHDAGVVRIQASSLPTDLRERFRINMVPMRDPSDEVAGSVASAKAQPVATTPAAPSTSPPMIAPKTAQLYVSIRDMEKKMAEFGQTRDAYLRQVEDYRRKDIEAKHYGKRPQYVQVIRQIDAAASALSAKISELNTKVGDLRNEIENGKSIPN